MNSVIEIFKKTSALLEGHFRLTSGLHSPVYFQCAKVLQYPEYCQLMAKKIVNHFKKTEIDVVISPAIGGIVVGQEVGRQLGVRTIFAERDNGKMTLRRGFELHKNERVLICEDVITTGGSVFEVIDVVKECNAKLTGIGYIVDRSTEQINFGAQQFSVIRMPAKTYSDQECPLCKKNIPIIKPGSRK
jgi:orotate phosphoribosyltransferase